MDREKIAAWLVDYVRAWRSNDPRRIEALFSADADYRYHPYEDPVVGAEAIAADWLEDPDEPDSWEASYVPVAVDGDTAVAVGTSRYRSTEERSARTYHNCFLLRFDDDGRCREFTEWYVRPHLLRATPHPRSTARRVPDGCDISDGSASNPAPCHSRRRPGRWLRKLLR